VVLTLKIPPLDPDSNKPTVSSLLAAREYLFGEANLIILISAPDSPLPIPNHPTKPPSLKTRPSLDT